MTNSMKTKLCALVAIILLYGSSQGRRCSSGTVKANSICRTHVCEEVQRFPYAMSAVVTQIYQS